MFKIESYIGPLLMSYLNKYVKLNEESFKLSLWGGDAVFHNVELQCDILEHLMLLPIGFKSGQVHELKVHIPWTKLGSESVVITLNTVECILELKSDFIKKSKSETSSETQTPEKLSPEKQKSEKNVPPSYLKSYLFNIINNIHVKVNNLIIKFVEDDIVLSMNAKTLEYFPVTEQWSKGFINLSPGNLKVYKKIEVFDLTICLDQMDSNGQIDVYQEPILYRCGVECRIFTSYHSISANAPNFMKFNIKFGEIDLNISTSQMPMLRRLIELIYALYYGIINWDSIVGCGFSKQVIVPSNSSGNRDLESPQAESLANVDNQNGDGKKSWASWAWSYVPSIFSEEEMNSDEDQLDGTLTGSTFKKSLAFGIFFESIHIKIKKFHVTKSIYGSRRSSGTKILTHFFTIVGNNIGIHVVNNGLGFFNVQLGCTEIKVFSVGNICVCGQEIPDNKNHNEKFNCCHFIQIGRSDITRDNMSNFYLTGNLFSTNELTESNILEEDILRLNSVTSHETYVANYSQEKCLENFQALWFDYVYFLQIIKNNLEESQIDLQNLCNTDGIRESSHCNLYIGRSFVDINSYFFHNMKEIVNSLDTSKYLSYFRKNTNEEQNLFCTTEEQMARIHEFVPLREHQICINNLSIKLHTFIESHQITDEFPILEIKTKCAKFTKLAPMYPKHLVGCVSSLNTTLLKESSELVSKCCVTKNLEITGVSISFLLPIISFELTTDFLRNILLEPCDITLNTKGLLFPETWKTSSLILNEKILSVSKIKMLLIPSHVKAIIVILASNYPWINAYMSSLIPKIGFGSLYKRLDDLTLQLIGSQSSLIESCHKGFYKSKTFELHVCLPNFILKSRETLTSRFIDAKIYHNSLLLFLRDPDSLFTIPVLDNTVIDESHYPSQLSELCILSCQIPKQIKPINCIFNIKCQIGSINFMFSQSLISWFIYPLLDLDLDKYIESDIVPMFTSIAKNSSTNRNSVTISDLRSMADGSSRPESPNIFYNKKPVPGHPKPINFNIDKSNINKDSDKIKFLSNKTGWWNLVKDSCSKYFFLLQSLDVCIKMSKSNFYISTITDVSSIKFNYTSCNEFVDNYLKSVKSDGSIFVMKMTRLVLINSQRRESLNENFQTGLVEPLHFQSKQTTIDSFPWELIFHDIRIDCLHSIISTENKNSKLQHDSILKPVSVNCTLSATPKCSSPDKLDSLYSVSWGIHVDITEVQPTIKQIYLSKLLKFFGDIIFGLPWTDFLKNIQYFTSAHWRIFRGNFSQKYATNDPYLQRSKQSISTKSTKKSKSSTGDQASSTSKSRIVNSKFETHLISEVETEFKMSFWIQCTLSQFQLVVMNDNIEMDHTDPYVYIMLQIDDATSCIDVQEKFVEIKAKLGSILCQIGLMKQEKIISAIPILKTGSKFINNSEMPFSYNSTDEIQNLTDLSPDNIIRHCLSVAVIRTTPNNLSKRPISTYHQFKDNESFKSYPTEFTGNFSTAINPNNTYKSYITQISSIVEPFDLYLPPFFLKQCLELSNSFLMLCNQLVQTSIQKWSVPNKMPSSISASSIKNEPYFISEDMPQFHLLVKSSRIVFPRFQNEKPSIYDHQGSENGCLILIWKKLCVQPLSNNAISRPSIIEKTIEDDFTLIDSHLNSPNCLDDNRQFQLDIFQCGFFLNMSSNFNKYPHSTQSNFDSLQCELNRSSEIVITSVSHGQNPAFEWNNYSKLSSFLQNKNIIEVDLLPIMKPIDIQIIFAGAIHDDSSNMSLKRQLIGGYGLEINILTNLEFFFDNYALDVITSISNTITDIFAENHIKNDNVYRNQEIGVISDIRSLEDFCRMKNVDNFLPCVPINILVTTRKIQYLSLLQQTEESNKLSSCFGISLSISQPHALLSYKNPDNHKLEIEFFDVNCCVTPTHWSEKIDFTDPNKLNFWYNKESFISAEMKTVMKTNPGRPNLKTGVPASLLTISFSNFYRSPTSHSSFNVTRQILFNVDVNDLIQLNGFVNLLTMRLGKRKSKEIPRQKISSYFPWTIFLPNSITASSDLVSINISDNLNSNNFELKFGPINLSSKLIRNYEWNNLYSTTNFTCDSLGIIHSGLDHPQFPPKFILYPLKITGNIILNVYRFNSLNENWKSHDWISSIDIGVINLCLDDNQLIILNDLLQQIINIFPIVQSVPESVPNTNVDERIERQVEIFYDDLRTNKFQLYTNLSIKENDYVSIFGSNIIADEATISFSDENDDVASMLWTYPEPRCILSLEVKPVPFVFIECSIVKDDNYEQLQIPCRLEYWNISTNEYELYQTFNLSENETNKMEYLPTIEQLSEPNKKFIVAKSWRVVFDCYARYFSVDNKMKTYSEKAMLVYLSPLVLAASMRIDSCYGSFLCRNSFLKLSVPLMEIVFLEEKTSTNLNNFKPYKSINETYTDYSISNNKILFKCLLEDLSFKNTINEMIEIEVLKNKLLLSDPFFSLHLPVVMIENLKVNVNQSKLIEEQLTINVDTCQIGFDTISLKQLYLTVEKIRHLIIGLVDGSLNSKTTFSAQPVYMICNNLDRRIRIKQRYDRFLKLSDSAKIGGLGSGEAVTLKFLPSSQNKGETRIDSNEISEQSQVEILIGLCSELKGSIRWASPFKLPLPNMNDFSASAHNFGIWNLDNQIKSDISIAANSSTISNSFNAKNLFYLHNQYTEGLNKVIIMGNTIINNLTDHFIHINFSLPTEISSGISFNVPPRINSIPISQYINWKIMSTSMIKNIFELSFRIVNNCTDNIEFRSLAYSIDVPKLSEFSKTHYQQQTIIKLKLYKSDGQVISTQNLYYQFLCTLEWFKFTEAEEFFLLVTVSPLVIFENVMLCDVKLEILNLELESINDEKLIIEKKGGSLKLMNLFYMDEVKLNAFINDNVKIFDEPLHLTEQGILESLNKKINSMYENYNSIDDKEKMIYIANLLTQIIENNEFVEKNLFKHNLYSVVVTITPWILISNKSEINLVLSFDKSIYFLESNSDFVPSKSDKPVCIGVMYENDVYWSFRFSVGQNTIDQIENSFTDTMWNFTNKDLKDEAFLQMKINVGKSRYIVPLSLKHIFIENESKGDSQYNKFYHLIIEPCIYISNCSGIDLDIEALCLVSNSELCADTSSNQRRLSSKSGYSSINNFCCIYYPAENNYVDQLIVKLNLSDGEKCHSISDNCFVPIDLSILSTKTELDNYLETKFLFLKDIKEGSKFINFKAFTVNSTVNFGTKKVFIDIFECKFVPIIITNLSNETIFFDELITDRWNKYVVVELEPAQSVPFWPADFQKDINKEGCGNFSRPYDRFRVGTKLAQEICWTEYFPLVNIDLPSKMDMSTVDGKQNWQFLIENETRSKIHIKIYNKNHQFIEPTIENSPCQIKKLSISQLSFSLLERSSNMETLVESVRVSVEKLNCILAKKSKEDILYEISANHLQVDNKFFSSGLYDFPVLFNSIKTQPNQSFVVLKIETNSHLTYSLDITFHNELELFIENIFLYDLLRLFSKFYQCLFSSATKSVDSVLSISPFNIIRISVSRILLRLTVHAFLKIYVSCEATSLALPELIITDSALRMSGLQKYFWHHYVTAVLVRCGCVLGSIELLGNPNGIFRHLTIGLTDLLSSRNIDHGLLVDFLLRLLSFCRYTSGGFISSFTGIVSSVSRNLDYFTLDNTHITRQELLRRQTQSSGVMVGFIRGLSGLALSLLGAVAGLADQPLQASQEALQANSSLSIAVIKGLGKGLIGVVTKPLSGTAELLAQTGRGFLNTTGITINRNHSDLVQFTLTSNLDIVINVSQFLNFLLNDGVVYEENSPILYWSTYAINDDQIPVYLFLTNQHLIEWHIDKPMKNDKIFHALSNYNISISSHSIYKNCLTLKYCNANKFVNIQSDNRINSFISDLQYAKEVVEPITNKNSHASSTDSTEYVKFVSVPNVVLNNQINVGNNLDTTLIHCETMNFYSNQLFDGLFDALSFLRNRQDRFNSFIN